MDEFVLNAIFGKYWSISPEKWDKQCMKIYHEPEATKEKYIKLGYIRIVADNHIEFIRH